MMKVPPGIKTVTLADFLTPEEIGQAWDLYVTLKETGSFAASLDATLIAPRLARINAALGQENDSRFLAYMVEYVFRQSEG